MYAGHFAAGLAMRAHAVRARREQAHPFGGRAAWVCAVVVALHAANSPWLSPTV